MRILRKKQYLELEQALNHLYDISEELLLQNDDKCEAFAFDLKTVMDLLFDVVDPMRK